jgi:hypothetical protein
MFFWSGSTPIISGPMAPTRTRSFGFPSSAVIVLPWVKAASFPSSVYDRYLVCFCHAIMFRNDIPSPANYRQWRDLLDKGKAERFKHGAKNPARPE